ncbi:MAG: RDD family protein [Chitinophagaceae bacterium]
MDYQPQPTVTTDLFQTEPVVYATFWERFAATFIDGIILIIPGLIVQYMLGKDISNLANLVIGWLYYALQESSPTQATIGKKALGIKVTDMEGQRISFGRATGRHFGKIISTIILFIGYFMMLWNEKRQTLHDSMAQTLVVKG